MNLEHIVVPESKEMLKKTRQSISLFCMSVSTLLPCKSILQYHFSIFRIYALEYDIYLSLSDLGGQMYGKSIMETYITICKIDSQREFATRLRKLKQGSVFS